MEIRAMDFFLGIVSGLALGVGVTWAAVKLKGLFGASETRRLKEEISTLQRRLKEKDRHVARMLAETEKLVNGLSQVHLSPPPSQLQ